MPPDAMNTRGLAVLLGGMASDHLALLDYLAGTFAAAMPSATRVQRRGLFNRGRAESVRVHLGDVVFELRDHAGQVEPSIGSSVGGVALSREKVTIDAWVVRFAAALDDAARSSDHVRAALANLV
jgi:hypothetical protein